MNIGFLGMGKLGLPCALAVNSKGHRVFGFDKNPEIKRILNDRVLPYRERGADKLLQDHSIEVGDLVELVQNSDIIFVPIQTPHNPLYEGITRLPPSREDFDYSWLKSGIEELSNEINRQGKDKVVIIISTVLPGTIRREIKPLLSSHVKLCYNPFFIAMGTTIDDFLSPEFVLFGVDDDHAYTTAVEFYSTIHNKQVFKCSIEEAEMIKVTYNTFITMKICLANTVMEMSHKLKNINCDTVMNALFLANERLISPKYLLGGMGDSGGCHPRDNIALSWLAEKNNLSYNWYDNLMRCRESQTEWLADILIEYYAQYNLPIIILGKTFKKETNLITGSCSILLKNILDEKGVDSLMYDPYTDLDSESPHLSNKAIFFMATNHDNFKEFKFIEGSLVIDPWRFMKKQDGVSLVRIGDSSY